MMCVKLIEYTQSGNNLFTTDGHKWQLHAWSFDQWQLHGPLASVTYNIPLIKIHFSVDFMEQQKRIWSLILLIDIIKP